MLARRKADACDYRRQWQTGPISGQEFVEGNASIRACGGRAHTRKAGELAALGVQLRPADYARPESLAAAFAGADKILLISSSEVGQREAQHRAVTDAAKAAGAKLLVYTSILRAESSTLALAPEHKVTEEYIRSSGMPFVFLRNGWYLEIIPSHLRRRFSMA